jgi:energy-coupling factor transporter ATP-binding protein EcfA2
MLLLSGIAMKLEELEIRAFRGIEHLKLDSRDELGRIHPRMSIVGPNTSGKTTILDAVALCLMPVTELTQLRDGLSLTPPSIVRRGAIRARVTCTVCFSDDEIEATREVLERAGHPRGSQVPRENRVKVVWEYPDPQGKARTGYNRFEPRTAWLLFKGRVTAARSLYVPGISRRYFDRLGGIVLFDQQRTGLAKRITSRERALLSQMAEPESNGPHSSREDFNGIDASKEFTNDPRLILLSLAARAQAEQDPQATDRQDYERLCQLYAQVCRPHRIRGLYNTDYGLDMEFEGDQGNYRFDGLSSGQEMILLMLLQFATRRIHRSIVLIDELELHLHPLWQERLYHALDQLGTDNQFLLTTHSTHLRDLIRNDLVHCMGDLGERAAIPQEA